MPANPPPTGHSTTATVCQGEASSSKATVAEGRGRAVLERAPGSPRVPRPRTAQSRRGPAPGRPGARRRPIARPASSRPSPARSRPPARRGRGSWRPAGRAGRWPPPVRSRGPPRHCRRLAVGGRRVGGRGGGAGLVGLDLDGQRFPAGERRHERGLPGHGGRLVRQQEVAGGPLDALGRGGVGRQADGVRPAPLQQVARLEPGQLGMGERLLDQPVQLGQPLPPPDAPRRLPGRGSAGTAHAPVRGCRGGRPAAGPSPRRRRRGDGRWTTAGRGRRRAS